MARLLPKTRLTLRWMFRGAPGAWMRAQIQRTAEAAADRDLGAAGVLDLVITTHGERLTASEIIEVGRALRVDLPAEDLGSVSLRELNALARRDFDSLPASTRRRLQAAGEPIERLIEGGPTAANLEAAQAIGREVRAILKTGVGQQ